MTLRRRGRFGMTTVSKESLAARIAELEAGSRSLKEDFQLEAYQMLLSRFQPIYQMQALDGSELQYEWVEVTEEEYNMPMVDRSGWNWRIVWGDGR